MGVNSNIYTAPRHKAVTPSDTDNITPNPRALYIGTGGTGIDVAVADVDGTVVVYKNVPSGFYVLVQAIRVNSTGTTATDIVALY